MFISRVIGQLQEVAAAGKLVAGTVTITAGSGAAVIGAGRVLVRVIYQQGCSVKAASFFL
jgi:hypothetical protein